MTQDQFFKHLKKLSKNKWRLSAKDMSMTIRCARGDCPMAAVAKALGKKSVKTEEWADLGEKLGLPRAVASRIVDAADNTMAEINDGWAWDDRTRKNIINLRKRLLRAVGLDWMIAIENG
jgi:hypothetical protein